MTIVQSDNLRNDKVNAVGDRIDGGANPGALRLWTGTDADGTEIAVFTFPANGFDSAPDPGVGVITLNGVPISTTTSSAGTVQSFDVTRDQAGTPEQVFHGDFPGDGTINNATVVISQDLDLNSMTITEPAS